MAECLSVCLLSVPKDLANPWTNLKNTPPKTRQSVPKIYTCDVIKERDERRRVKGNPLKRDDLVTSHGSFFRTLCRVFTPPPPINLKKKNIKGEGVK